MPLEHKELTEKIIGAAIEVQTLPELLEKLHLNRRPGIQEARRSL